MFGHVSGSAGNLVGCTMPVKSFDTKLVLTLVSSWVFMLAVRDGRSIDVCKLLTFKF